uniref:Transmembrane protein 50A n=1 Tax=Chlamydomonas euryale TaxID=1486919 RepID=A0A7R9V005_9CHLO
MFRDICYAPEYFISPAVIKWWRDNARQWGPVLAGALFGAGWWFWADAVALSPTKIPFDHYLPGLIATLALVMINLIRKDELAEIDPFDDATYCRARVWLFISYVVSFSSIVAAVWVLIAHYSSNPDLSSSEKWPGAAGIFQVSFILGSGLLFFLSRTPGESSSYEGYGTF